MLEVNDLSLFIENGGEKTYLLKDVTFHIEKGDRLGIIGKSGDGKSTLAKALLKIFDKNVYLEKGSILLNKTETDESFRGKRISLLFQNPNSYLNPLMKVGRQIDEMLVYHFKENKKDAKKKTIGLMKEIGLDNAEEVYNYYPYEISGGMQQKVCLCIALICKPEVLILDECTSYLDKVSKYDVLNLINEFQKKYKFTLILISHDFKEIYTMCNKIAVMRKGQLIEFGNTDEIILNPSHPYTIELLLDYLRYYKNIFPFTSPFMEIEKIESAPIVQITNTHYVRNWYLDERAIKLDIYFKFNEVKETLYESIRN